MKRSRLAIIAALGPWMAPITSAAQDGTVNPGSAQVAIAGPVLMVSDLERSLKFYVGGLGMKVARRLPGNPGPGAIVTSGDAASPFILLRQHSQKIAPSARIEIGSGLSRIMLSVADAEAARARLRAAGYAHDPVSRTKIFFVSDPDGYRYEVIERAAHH